MISKLKGAGTIGTRFVSEVWPPTKDAYVSIVELIKSWVSFNLRNFLIENGFMIGKADSTLFTRKMRKYLFVCHIYVDDIIFGSTNKFFCDEFSKIMMDRFEMSLMEVITFFLRF
jgi:hypothetical protein